MVVVADSKLSIGDYQKWPAEQRPRGIFVIILMHVKIVIKNRGRGECSHQIHLVHRFPKNASCRVLFVHTKLKDCQSMLKRILLKCNMPK